jgi:hypothetical protein
MIISDQQRRRLQAITSNGRRMRSGVAAHGARIALGIRFRICIHGAETHPIALAFDERAAAQYTFCSSMPA